MRAFARSTTLPGVATMRDYYARSLSGERLRRCYEIAPPRVRDYLEAEIRFVLERLRDRDIVLELGCGYGRVTTRLTEVAERAVGIDTSEESLSLARQLTAPSARCSFLKMDALNLSFEASEFDKVVCVQNGISAFGVDQPSLLRQALRVTRAGGCALFSTYSEGIWLDRLLWFEEQAAAGLVGEIDYERTGNGVIACKDGFRSGVVSRQEFESLGSELGLVPTITEIDESSVFCEFVVPDAAPRRLRCAVSIAGLRRIWRSRSRAVRPG